MSRGIVYVRRSYKVATAADVSDETQEAVARSLIPAGASVEVIRDSGGHNSGATDDRDGYQRLIQRIREGGISFIAVYDLSRLARNVRLMANLLHELDRQQIVILAGNLPNTRMDSAVGRFMFHMLVSAAQFQRDLDSERMKAMMARTFEDGGHCGGDPFGYMTARDESGNVIHPRTLVPVPEEAAVVVRTFREIAQRPFSEVAQLFNREGVRHRTARPWTSNSIKDIWRRREVYRGNVTKGRGLDVRPGRHEPIVDDGTYRDAVAAVEARRRQKGRRPRTSKRLYLLRGLVFCTCGARMRGDARLSRGQEWRYYCCPVAAGRSGRFDDAGRLVLCDARRLPAAAAESAVIEAVSRLRVPTEVMDSARDELKARLRAPRSDATHDQRARLKTRLEKLAELYSWGDLTENAYRTQRAEVGAQLAALPDANELAVFDRNRDLVLSLPEALAAASGDRVQELLALLVERVDAADQRVVGITWTPPARPFFAEPEPDTMGQPAPFWRPRTDSNRRRAP